MESRSERKPCRDLVLDLFPLGRVAAGFHALFAFLLLHREQALKLRLRAILISQLIAECSLLQCRQPRSHAAARIATRDVPIIAYGTPALGTLIGPRLGCRTWNGIDSGFDLAALCLSMS